MTEKENSAKDSADAELHRSLSQFLTEKLGESYAYDRSQEILPSVEIHPERVEETVRLLKGDPFHMDFLDSITGVDLLNYPGPEQDRSVVPWSHLYQTEERLFLLLYNLYSYDTRQRINLKVLLPEHNLRVATIDHLFGNANWLEREIFDLLGIHFEGSRDLRRIMLPEDWKGYPLRRDYAEEESYHGMGTVRPDPMAPLVRQAEEMRKRFAAEAAERLDREEEQSEEKPEKNGGDGSSS